MISARDSLGTLVNLPAETAVIEPAKLREYLLSLDHPDGRGKARYLALLGYTREHWERLARDLRQQILPLDAQPAGESRWGVKYEILGLLRGRTAVPPGSGRSGSFLAATPDLGWSPSFRGKSDELGALRPSRPDRGPSR
jgi:hypothetical protein